MSLIRKTIPYIIIIAGALLASFSVACILLPNDAIDYGTAGIGIIISKLTGLNLSLSVMIVFLPFLIFGGIYMGKEFLLKALAGSVAYMAGLEIFAKIPFELNTEHFLAVAFGGAILGLGLSLILRNGGCIDGSEILANIITASASRKTGKNYSLSKILLIFNALVYIAVFFLIDRDSALLSLLVYVVATAIVDHYTNRFESIKKVTIITKKPDEVAERIMSDLNRTCTIYDSRGVISGANSTVICFINYFEFNKIRHIAEIFSDSSFITISTVDEIIR